MSDSLAKVHPELISKWSNKNTLKSTEVTVVRNEHVRKERWSMKTFKKEICLVNFGYKGKKNSCHY